MKMNRNYLLLPRISLFLILFALPAEIAFRPISSIPSIQILYSSSSAHYYELVDSAGLSWEQARVAAEARTHRGLHGHLVTVTSAEENAVIFLLGDLNGYYLGGFRDTSDVDYSEPDGGWKWVTGEPWDYTAWKEDETSDDVSRTRNYLFGWGDDSWVAGEGTTEHGYVVEYESRQYKSVCAVLPKDSVRKSPVTSPVGPRARTGG